MSDRLTPLKNRDLKKLGIRSIIALTLRAFLRVESHLKNSSYPLIDKLNTADKSVYNVSLLLIKSFCNAELHESSRLAHIMDESKWDSDSDAYTSESNNLLFESINRLCSAAMEAQFSHNVEPYLPTLHTGNRVITHVQKGLSILLESTAINDSFQIILLKEIWNDYNTLLIYETVLFPELGSPIDSTTGGLLGYLWHEEQSSRNITPSELNIKNNIKIPEFTNDLRGHISTDNLPILKDTNQLFPKEGYLYKYVTMRTLFRILETSTLRFSQISSFNDPFDGQLLPIRKYGGKKFFEALHHEIENLIILNQEDIYVLPEDIPTEEMISASYQNLKNLMGGKKTVAVFLELDNTSEEAQSLANILRPLIYLAQQGKLGSTQEALKHISGLLDLFKGHRVTFPLTDGDQRMVTKMSEIMQALCLSENFDSMLMWSHYAEDHAGAVLKFDVFSKYAGYFKKAQQIKYRKTISSIESPKLLARKYLGLPIGSNTLTSRQFLIKGSDWEYESEWRVMATVDMKKHGEFIPFNKKCLTGIYLGCRASAPAVGTAIDLIINRNYPADLYLGMKDETEFSLNFIPLMNGRTRTQTSPKLNLDRRASLYQECLDSYLDFWNKPEMETTRVKQALFRLEGMLADYGPTGSYLLFREMISTLYATAVSPNKITADKEDQPKQYHEQLMKLLQPSAKAYGALEDALKDDLSQRGTK